MGSTSDTMEGASAKRVRLRHYSGDVAKPS